SHRRGVPPFRGEVGEFKTIDHPCDRTELTALLNSMSIPRSPPQTPIIEFTRSSAGYNAEVWREGAYSATTADGRQLPFRKVALPQPYTIEGPWDLQFPAGQGAPDRVSLPQLISWSEHENPGVRYFSGTGTYSNRFELPASFLQANQPVYLDLGKVAVMARVKLNGHDVGILWKPPFRTDVTKLLQRGHNSLEIQVVNLWPNRMIGDEQLPEDSDRK